MSTAVGSSDGADGRRNRIRTEILSGVCQVENTIPEFFYFLETHKTIVKIGGRERIRTSGSLTTTSDFESDAFNHSATLPTVDSII